MAYFEHFPYTNFHDINLDRMIDLMEQFRTELADFVNLNTVKYADPFDWDITTQYPTNTIVMDPSTGVAYISVRPVPAGAPITDTSYWTPVFDLTALFEGIKDSIAAVVEQSTSATVSSPAGTLIWVGNTLYEAQVAITAGDTYRPGGNVEHVTIEELLNRLKAEQAAQAQALAEETEARVAEDTAINTRIDNLHFAHDHATEHVNIYVDTISGNDSMRGLTEDTAVKTLKRAWDICGETAAGVYIHLLTDGTYDMGYPVINSVQAHILAESTNITITWGWDTAAWTLAFYNSYIHLQGYSADYPVHFNMVQNVGSDPKRAYLESGKIFAQDVVFNQTSKQLFGVVGGYGQFTRCTFDKMFVSSGNVVFTTCTFAPSDQNAQSTSAIWAYNGAQLTFASGTYYTDPGTHTNTTAFMSASASIIDVRNVAPNLRQLQYGCILNQSYFTGSDVRVLSWLTNTQTVSGDPKGQTAQIYASNVNDVIYYPVQGTSGPLKLVGETIPHTMFYPGETYRTNVHHTFPAFLTSSGRHLRFTMTLPKLLPDGATITINEMTISARGISGSYLLNNVNVVAEGSPYTVDYFRDQNALSFWVQHPETAFGTNNTVAVVSGTVSITITY